MTSEQAIERAYRERLDENIITHLAETYGMSNDAAMEAFYGSKLASKMDEGLYGVQYLDYRNLAQILADTEPERLAPMREQTPAPCSREGELASC